MNKLFLSGRLVANPEVRYTQTNNTLVATFRLAVNRKMEKDKADFFNIVAYGKTGEFASKYFKKGLLVIVTGRVQTRNYEDKDGKTTYVTEVIAEEVEFGESKKEEKQADFTPVTDADLPF